MAKLKNGVSVVVRGVISPAVWDEYDDVVEIKLQSSDEKEYLIEKDDTGEELFDYLHEETELKGIVTENEKGENVIRVTSYEVFADDFDSEDDWDDEDESPRDDEDDYR